MGSPSRFPRIRERVAEILPLARAVARRAVEQAAAQQMPAFSPEAMELLCHDSWPGNVRELRNVVTRAVLLSCGDVILRIEKYNLPGPRKDASD
jgi:DNA-binding NtrC family response regulator